MNSQLINKFIQKHKYYEPILRDLIDHTTILTKKEILDGFEEELLEWSSERKSNVPVYALIERNKVGSMNWLYFEFKDIFDQNNVIIYDNDMIIEDDAELLMFDDFSLFGCHMAGTFEDWMYDNKQVSSSFHKLSIICYSMTKDSSELMKSFDGSKGYEWLSKVKLYYKINLNKYVPRLDVSYQQMWDRFNIEFNPDTEEPSYAFFTEYKIPNQWASYPLIYNELYTVDREFMKDVPKLFDSQKMILK